MLSELRLGNFKAFGAQQTVPLRRITLLYGPNSVGKSSVLQSLLLLKQTLERRDGDSELGAPDLMIRGSLTDLGSFKSLLHGHRLDRELTLGIDFKPGGSQRYNPAALGRGTRSVDFRFRWDKASDAALLDSTTLAIQESLAPVTFKRVPGPVNREGWLGPAAKISDAESLYGLATWLMQRRARRLQGRFPREVAKLEMTDGFKEALGRLEFGVRGLMPVAHLGASRALARRPESEAASAASAREHRDSVLSEWEMVGHSLAWQLADALRAVAYLGPLRKAPQRFHVFTGASRVNVGTEGEHAVEFLGRRSDVLDEVNDWFRRFGIPYDLDIQRINQAQIADTLGDVVSLVLKDRRNGVVVSPGDVGFGISQLLPVIVQLLLEGNQLVVVEQPEIHVHPRLQAELADLLIASTREHKGTQALIETHSEHLLLRLQRRIRDGALSHEDVSVLYVDSVDGAPATVTRLRLDEDGEFLDEWPDGFFEERFAEVFGF